MTIRNIQAAALLRRHLNVLKLGTGALAIAVSSSFAVPAVAQQTTSSMTGLVLLPNGEPATGATVEIVHVPSGTRSTASVNSEGRFNAAGLRVGGPYNITFSGQGIPRQVVEGVFTRLGEPYALDLVLESTQGTVDTMEEIVVTGERITQQLAMGSGRNFDEEAIRRTPTISRSIADVVRQDPKVFIDRANADAISIAGTNNRFNSLTVDGMRQNDDFGLNASGFATRRSPISLDAVEAIAVQTAPFDVKYSGFQGGNINLVTKSGTNEFHGSAFYLYSDDSLIGDESDGRQLDFTFKEKTYGATLGGPIIQDKLFFFTSYEKFDRSAPVSTGPAGSGFPNEAGNVSLADYNEIISILRTVYNYDPLDLPNSVDEDDEKILAKIDWNINDDHRASFTFQQTEGGLVEQTGSGSTSVAAPSHWYNSATTLKQYTAQLFSDWTADFSTELRVGRKEVETISDPLNGRNFAHFGVRTTDGGFVNVGPDISRHANYLTNDQNQISISGQYLLGDHTLTAGFDHEEVEVFNVFVQRSLGDFDFDSIEDLRNRRAARLRYRNSFTNNADAGAAAFGYKTDSFYAQDEWAVTPDLRLTLGLRYEIFSSKDEPLLNQNFLTRYGFSNTETLDGRDLWQPRFGFNYDLDERTTVRGGFGLFGGGTPNVWISNSFSNDGVTLVDQDYRRSAAGVSPTVNGEAVLDNVTGQVPQSVLDRNTTLRGDGSVNAIDPDFNIPSSWRYVIGIDREFDFGGLGDGWRFSAEAIYTNVRDGVIWQNLSLDQTGTAPDGRPVFTRRADRSAQDDLVLTNTSKGSSLVLSTDMSKDWETGYGDLGLFVGYAYTDAEDVNPGTSSVAFSNWQNLARTNPNDPELATSNYEIKHRFTWSASWSREFFEGFRSTLTVLGEHRSGLPYSLVFGGGSGASASTAFGDEGLRARQLFYVPATCDEVIFQGGLDCDKLNAFIADNGLEKYRGEITPRNAFRSDWVHTVDLSFRQEIPSFLEGHRASFTLDVMNFTNLLNNKWGRIDQVQFPNAETVARATVDPVTGKYIYAPVSGNDFRDPVQRIDDDAVQNAVWRIQVGVRYEF